MLWPFPVFCGSGKPLGDGIHWPTNKGDESNRSHGPMSASNDVNRKQRAMYRDTVFFIKNKTKLTNSSIQLSSF